VCVWEREREGEKDRVCVREGVFCMGERVCVLERICLHGSFKSYNNDRCFSKYNAINS